MNLVLPVTNRVVTITVYCKFIRARNTFLLKMHVSLVLTGHKNLMSYVNSQVGYKV
jgi:hypothetical protein